MEIAAGAVGEGWGGWVVVGDGGGAWDDGAALYGWSCCCFCSGVPEPSSAFRKN